MTQPSFNMQPPDLPELQPEIWAHIVTFLKKQLPPLGTESSWSELSQAHLATAMRINTVSPKRPRILPKLYRD